MLRSFLFSAGFSLLFMPSIQAQECYPFDDPDEGAPSSQELEMKYAGKDSASSKSVGPSDVHIPDVEGLDTSYRNFVSELASYLYDNGFKWEERTRYFQRIYFEQNGEAAYYLYQFRNNAPSGERKELFEKLVEEYLAENSLPVSSEARFALCAPVDLRPKEDEGE